MASCKGQPHHEHPKTYLRFWTTLSFVKACGSRRIPMASFRVKKWHLSTTLLPYPNTQYELKFLSTFRDDSCEKLGKNFYTWSAYLLLDWKNSWNILSRKKRDFSLILINDWSFHFSMPKVVFSKPILTIANEVSTVSTTTHCLKIIQNVAFEFLNFGIFHQFLSY